MRLIVTQTNQNKNERDSQKHVINLIVECARQIKVKKQYIIKYIDVSHAPLCADRDKILFISHNGDIYDI